MLRSHKLLDEMKYVASRCVYRACTWISPYFNTQFRFLRITGHIGNLKTPVTFSEKLSWLKLYRYAEDPLVMQCADKWKVRDYVTQCGLGHMLVPLHGIFEKPEEIPWGDLPDKFVLKWNFGCGFNVLCEDKDNLDIPTTMRQLRKWGRTPYWMDYAELQYRIPEKRILCEEFLETPAGEELLDFKFYCFHGKPLAILVIARPAGREKAAVFMSPQWEFVSDISARYRESFLPERPESLGEMLMAAEKLSSPFPFVRVDFYEQKGKPFFGELTFTPATGICPSETMLHGKSMGEYISLNGMKR